MQPKTEQFGEQARAAVANAALRQALERTTSRFVIGQRQAAAELPGWEELRARAHEIKRETIEYLDRYLEQFTERLAAAGAHVYWARDAADACTYLLHLASERGFRRLVKSKSMATEEIGLNHAVEAAGLEVVETDLGEFIIQLLDDVPSHILAPAIHKTKRDVAQLFREKFGMNYTEEVEQLTAQARAVLRDRFLAAEIGVSGVNFGVAETGTLVIVENEGNARLTTSLPPVHVAVMGIEKIIPRLADLSIFLQLLPRSATGQKMPVYVSLLTGAKRRPGEEGPDELHVVLLDNGRTRILADPVQREALYCIRCGACLNICPVYQRVGGHAYGWVYQGPIGALITPQLVGLGRATQLPFASSLCGACKDICPVKINIPDLLLDLRGKIKGNGGPALDAPWAERLAMRSFAAVMSRPALYRLGTRLARLLQKPFVRGSYLRLRRLPGLAGWTRTREFPALAARSFRDQWRRDNPDA